MKNILLLLVCLLFLNSCASIVSKSQYPLTITTDPSGANVTVRDHKGMDIFKGTSPTTLMLDAGAGFFKRASYQVVVNKPGFQEQMVPVTFRTDGWYWGNLLLGGIIGMLIIDPATGAMYKINNEYVSLTLAEATASTGPQLQIYDIETIPEHWKSKLEKVEQ